MRANKKLIYILLTAIIISFGGCALAASPEDAQEEQNLVEAARTMRSSGRI